MRESLARLLDDVAAGARQAARTLRSRPGYTLAVLLTLALGIGANATVFAVWNALLLRPLPYPEPERLFVLQGTRPGPRGTPDTYVASPLDFVRWRNDSQAFEEIGALWPRDVGLMASGEPETVPAAALSASMFRLLGAAPMLGRVFTAQEDRPDSRLVYGVEPSDPATFALVASGLGVIAAAAAYLPARRAVLIDPALTLRAE